MFFGCVGIRRGNCSATNKTSNRHDTRVANGNSTVSRGGSGASGFRELKAIRNGQSPPLNAGRRCAISISLSVGRRGDLSPLCSGSNSSFILIFSGLPQPMSYPLCSARGREHIHRPPLPRAPLRRRPLNRTAHGRIAGHDTTPSESGRLNYSAALILQELQRLDVFGPVNSQSNHSIKMGVGRSNVVQTEPSGDGKIERIVGQ